MAVLLGIESSCDESSAAILKGQWNGQTLQDVEILAHHIASQIPIHARYGGVVPELASRNHVVNIVGTVQKTLDQAKCHWQDLDAIAVTQGPGLVGSLLVGLEAAKAMAYVHQLPLLGLHHIEAHFFAAWIEAEPHPPQWPALALIVSGGHTTLVLAQKLGQYRILGHTLDDAAGEALDKVGKMLGLPYPGGVHIDRLSQNGNPKAIRFPRALPKRDNYHFSFSGLKTSVRTFLQKLEHKPEGQDLADLCASVQEAVVDVLVRKTFLAAKHFGISNLVLAGGVSANHRLRQRMIQRAKEWGLYLSIPPKELCTDNGAMIAGLGLARWNPKNHVHFQAFEMDAKSSWNLESLKELYELT